MRDRLATKRTTYTGLHLLDEVSGVTAAILLFDGWCDGLCARAREDLVAEEEESGETDAEDEDGHVRRGGDGHGRRLGARKKVRPV